MNEQGYCLVSQQMRAQILNGNIKVDEGPVSLDGAGRLTNASLEGRIQPSSFEPTIGEEVFILDTEQRGVFLPEPTENGPKPC